MINSTFLRLRLWGIALFALAVPFALPAEDGLVAGMQAEILGPTQVADPRSTPSYGLNAAAVRTIHGFGFQESDSTTVFTYDAITTHRVRTGGAFPWFDAALPGLPAGAQLVGLELEACDTNAAAHASVTLFRHASPSGGNNSLGGVSTGDVATPGCAFFGSDANLPAGLFVDNENFLYFVRAELTALNSTTSLGAVRVYYKLRVSPAPAVATFTDVPTSHPFFQFIEALYAAGITGGCGAGIFCPNNPITRGEMAVFLAAALGLHFPS